LFIINSLFIYLAQYPVFNLQPCTAYLPSIEHPGVVSHALKAYLQPELRIYELALGTRPPTSHKSPHASLPFFQIDFSMQ
jgi:hypothetical protein